MITVGARGLHCQAQLLQQRLDLHRGGDFRQAAPAIPEAGRNGRCSKTTGSQLLSPERAALLGPSPHHVQRALPCHGGFWWVSSPTLVPQHCTDPSSLTWDSWRASASPRCRCPSRAARRSASSSRDCPLKISSSRARSSCASVRQSSACCRRASSSATRSASNLYQASVGRRKRFDVGDGRRCAAARGDSSGSQGRLGPWLREFSEVCCPSPPQFNQVLLSALNPFWLVVGQRGSNLTVSKHTCKGPAGLWPAVLPRGK